MGRVLSCCCKRTQSIQYSKIETESDQKARKCNKLKKGVAIAAIAIVILGALGILIGLHPSAAGNLLQNSVKALSHGKMSVGQSLLYIGVPILSGTLLTVMVIRINQNRRALREEEELVSMKKSEKRRAIIDHMLPSMKQAKYTIATTIALGVLALAGFLIFTYVHPAHQWLHQTAMPFVQHGLNHQIQVWQGLTYVGGASLGAAVLTNLAVHLITKCKNQSEKKNFLRLNFDDDFDQCNT